MNLQPLWLSLQLAGLTSMILLIVGLLFVYILHFQNFYGKSLIKVMVSLPLVLPPTVLGYYLLIAFQKTSKIGLDLAFSFGGLLVGSLLFSLPFMLNPIFSSLKQLPPQYEQLAFTMGKSKWITYTKIILPLIRPSIITGVAMSFAHTMGEFGLVWMIGGSIPGRTQVASIELFDLVDQMEYEAANQYALILLLISIGLLLLIQRIEIRKPS